MRSPRWIAGALSGALALACLAQAASKKGSVEVKKTAFGKTSTGIPVELYTLSNVNGMKVGIITYGGAVASLSVPDRHGNYADVVLGMDNLAGYQSQTNYFGALIGRYGNRIGHAQFELDGHTYTLPKNDGDNTLHGGKRGFDKRVWKVRKAEGAAIELSYVSADGEEGFPGALTARVIYTVTARNELKIEYTTSTSADTVINLTNHSYFNLAGAGAGDILQHQLTLNADRFTPVDAGLIPTGELRPVAGTPFDFTTSTAIGARIGQSDQQLQYGKGYDHNWVLNKGNVNPDDPLTKAAEVYDPSSGRVMEVFTTEPGVQFYTGNFLDGTVRGKGGKAYPFRGALCLETQHFPDSPNKPDFPTTELKPGETYHSTTVYRFSAR
jgi:aldose 1-epimerase